jgi:chromosome segregation ATPase
VTSETRSLVARCQFLEKSTEDLKTSLEDSTNECETKQEAILELEDRLDKVHKKLDSKVNELEAAKIVNEDKRSLKKEYEKVCSLVCRE